MAAKKTTRCVERTRTKGEGECFLCDDPIVPGEKYRDLLVMDGPLSRLHTHVGCAAGDAEWDAFELTPEDVALKAVRRKRGHRFRVGMPVVVLGMDGVISGGRSGYVLVRQNGVERQFIADHVTLS